MFNVFGHFSYIYVWLSIFYDPMYICGLNKANTIASITPCEFYLGAESNLNLELSLIHPASS
jgi:hypothetical protein